MFFNQPFARELPSKYNMRNLPFYTTQALDVLSNNMSKYGFLFALAYLPIGLSMAKEEALFVSNLIATIYILPFFMVSYWAGNFADKSDKVNLLRYLKLFDVLIVLAICAGLHFQKPYLVLGLMGLLGLKTAAFTPVKYGYLREVKEGAELISANGIIQATSLVGIIFAFMTAGLIMTLLQSETLFGLVLISISIIAYVASLLIPRPTQSSMNIAQNSSGISENTLQNSLHGFSFKDVTLLMKEKSELRFYLIAIAWFWLLGTSFMTQFINFIKFELKGSPLLATIALLVFVVGMSAGTLLSRYLHQRVRSIYALSGLGLSTLCYVIAHLHSLETKDMELNAATESTLFAVIFGIGLCATLFVVPLYARLQLTAPKNMASTVIGVSSIVNACFVVMSSAFAYWVLSKQQLGLVVYFEWLSFLNVFFILGSFAFINVWRSITPFKSGITAEQAG